MYSHLLDKIGDWNPQLLREIKGRLKVRNILLATSLSLLGQFILFMSFQSQLPTNLTAFQKSSNRYCTGSVDYDVPQCLSDGLDNVIINWQLWSFDIFSLLSLLTCIVLLVAGTHLLINDLATEQRRDTLNFIRLSPQTAQSILWGKILGVPILFYFGILLALPLHLWSGFNAQLSIIQILSFYAVVMTASVLYFSAALLFGLVGSWLGGFQVWLASGTLLSYFLFTESAIKRDFTGDSPANIVGLFNPYFLIPYPEIDHNFLNNIPKFADFHWYILQLKSNLGLTVGFALLVYCVGIFFIWESLQRCFQISDTTMLSKKQSYLLTSCFTLITLGTANWQKIVFQQQSYLSLMQGDTALLMILNFGLFLYLIAAVTPGRQTLIDWARYRHVAHLKNSPRGSLIYDLIWGEKSPGILAIAINAAIAITGISCFVLASNTNMNNKIDALFALAFGGILAVTYAALTQLVLFMKTEQRILWAAGILVAVIVLPNIIFLVLFSSPANNSFVWLFSVLAPLVVLFYSGEHNSLVEPLLAILGHFAILGFLILQLTRKLKKAGESATKALLVGN
ncbi:hypothetical protein [Nostoc sp. FACHB-110]|uniref:hypothetical protein n=1 Tax=Nostoc sp. FACHB-110 TaxID=2692834 RepID=UPI00168A2899|nr:hypothetical protein [Nostoc sp. FACHB-110]MBD2435357.1 hypothetical protein [Nostoc sp. FACHB-110]